MEQWLARSFVWVSDLKCGRKMFLANENPYRSRSQGTTPNRDGSPECWKMTAIYWLESGGASEHDRKNCELKDDELSGRGGNERR
jgi:hypothetical protein